MNLRFSVTVETRWRCRQRSYYLGLQDSRMMTKHQVFHLKYKNCSLIGIRTHGLL